MQVWSKPYKVRIIESVTLAKVPMYTLSKKWLKIQPKYQSIQSLAFELPHTAPDSA